MTPIPNKGCSNTLERLADRPSRPDRPKPFQRVPPADCQRRYEQKQEDGPVVSVKHPENEQYGDQRSRSQREPYPYDLGIAGEDDSEESR